MDFQNALFPFLLGVVAFTVGAVLRRGREPRDPMAVGPGADAQTVGAVLIPAVVALHIARWAMGA